MNYKKFKKKKKKKKKKKNLNYQQNVKTNQFRCYNVLLYCVVEMSTEVSMLTS